MLSLRFSTKQFRHIPSPRKNDDSWIGVFFAAAADVPAQLWDWREVNPREVKRGSSVFEAISGTLEDYPGRFHERNRGITIVADDVSFDAKREEVTVRLADPKLHGVVDGAHTLQAILDLQEQFQGAEWPAFVFIKAISGVDGDQIAEIAGGLNTSQQVDLKSLENLREHFDHLKSAISKEPYSDLIAYKMNENKPVDVREILYYLAVFDCTEYNEDNKAHPVALFGRKEGIVRRFAEQAKQPRKSNSFRILISRAPDILRLRDLIEEKALKHPRVGRFKAGKGTRVRSESNKKNSLVFTGRTVNGKIPLGWIMPMLAGFRANVSWDAPKGQFSWIVPIDELLDSCIEQLVENILAVHEQENSRPEYVGRNAISWRMSYNTVSQAILQRENALLRGAHR